METIVEGDFNNYLLDELEMHYIHLYNSRNKKIGYNIHKGGRSIKIHHKNELKIINKEKLFIENRDWAEQMLGKGYKFKEKPQKIIVEKINIWIGAL